MPCCCFFDPHEASKRLIKSHCQSIVDELHRLRKEGDPLGWELKDIHELIDHLFSGECPEKGNNHA